MREHVASVSIFPNSGQLPPVIVRIFSERNRVAGRVSRALLLRPRKFIFREQLALFIRCRYIQHRQCVYILPCGNPFSIGKGFHVAPLRIGERVHTGIEQSACKVLQSFTFVFPA